MCTNILSIVLFSVFCKKSFEDDPDVTEEEIEEELGIIRYSVRKGVLL